MRDGYYELTINENATGYEIKKEVHEFFEGILITIYTILGNGKIIEDSM